MKHVEDDSPLRPWLRASFWTMMDDIGLSQEESVIGGFLLLSS